MKRAFYISLSICLCICALYSCDDMKDFTPDQTLPEVTEATHLYVLCEGLFNMNNSTLASYNMSSQLLEKNLFLSVNQRGLGDTANDMVLHGDNLFIVVDVSSQIEVINARTGLSRKQIPLFNEQGVGRQPRTLIFHGDKGYLTCFDGHVLRIDTLTLEIDGICKVGRNPESLCMVDHKLYVTNSGGLDFPNYDNTVSVIDLNSFTEIKKIEVAKNPGEIHADSQGQVYLCSRGDYSMTPYTFQKIDTETDKLVMTFEHIEALKFKIYDDYAYIYNYDFITQSSWIKVFDCRNDELVQENFVTDGTSFDTPFGIDINPYNGDVYVTEAYNFVIWGDVLCFDSEGKLKFRLNEIGLNPNKVTFLNLKDNEI